MNPWARISSRVAVRDVAWMTRRTVDAWPVSGGCLVGAGVSGVRRTSIISTADGKCDAGHVLVNGSTAKPSTKVRAGDRVEALIADRKRIVEVIRPIESRVGAAVATTCFVDHSPPVVARTGPLIMLDWGEGRPSKRLRREFERVRRGVDA